MTGPTYQWTHLPHLVVAHAQDVLHQVVGLADQLHVSVLDPIVHHLDVVPGPVSPHPVTAWLAIDLGTDTLEDWFHMRPV